MSCEIVIAAEGTTFAITPAKLGVPYDVEGTLSFMQSVSLPVIKESCLQPSRCRLTARSERYGVPDFLIV